MSLESIAEALGPTDFNRLVDGYHETSRIGRLKFWQEKLLAKAVESTGIALTDYDTFIKVFADAQIVRTTVSKADFLANPSSHWYNPTVDFDPIWITDAWCSSPDFVENISYEISRSVSKTGEFGLAAEAVAVISGRLTPEQYATLYAYIRDDSQRMEPEWRDEFVQHFPKVKAVLPPMM